MNIQTRIPMKIVGTILFCCLLHSLLCSAALGQVKNAKKFSIIPKQERARLIERFNLYIEYDRAWQCGKLLDLYSEAHLTQQRQTKTSLIQVCESIPIASRSVLIEFDPISVGKPINVKEPGIFEIIGRVKVQRENKIVEEERILWAYLEKGNWYFSGWMARVDD